MENEPGNMCIPFSWMKKWLNNIIASLRSSLSQTDWSRIHNFHNADETFGIFNDTLISLLNEKIPPYYKIKINNKKTPRSPWLN